MFFFIDVEGKIRAFNLELKRTIEFFLTVLLVDMAKNRSLVVESGVIYHDRKISCARMFKKPSPLSIKNPKNTN